MKQKILSTNKKPYLIILPIAIFFALVSVFGLSLLTGNQKQSNVGNTKASAQQPADINNDNKVDITDLSILISKWNTNDVAADINDDGNVGITDLSMLLSKWGGGQHS